MSKPIESVYLRPLEFDDLPAALEWVNRPDIYQVMGIFGPRTAKQQEDWFHALAENPKNQVFAICLKSTDKHVGNCSFFDIDQKNRSAGITMFVGDPEMRGRGVGYSTTQELVRYGFEKLNLHRIQVKTDNPAAARIYDGLGFTHEGRLRDASFYGDSFHDKDIFSILETEYVKHDSAI